MGKLIPAKFRKMILKMRKNWLEFINVTARAFIGILVRSMEICEYSRWFMIVNFLDFLDICSLFLW